MAGLKTNFSFQDLGFSSVAMSIVCKTHAQSAFRPSLQSVLLCIQQCARLRAVCLKQTFHMWLQEPRILDTGYLWLLVFAPAASKANQPKTLVSARFLHAKICHTHTHSKCCSISVPCSVLFTYSTMDLTRKNANSPAQADVLLAPCERNALLHLLVPV